MPPRSVASLARFTTMNTWTVVRAVIQKIMGESEFKGQHFNEHVWGEKWEARR